MRNSEGAPLVAGGSVRLVVKVVARIQLVYGVQLLALVLARTR